MRLTHIKISNHSRLADYELDVREHLVLVGPNDVGKSSLLRCLNFLLGASTAQLYNRITVDDFTNLTQPLVIEATLSELTDTEKGWFPDEPTVDPAIGTTTLTITLKATIDDNGTLEIDRSAPNAGTNRQLSRDQIQALGWTLLDATSVARDLRDDRRNVLTDILAGVDLGTEQATFDTLLAQIQTEVGSSRALDALRGDLAGQLSRALPVGVGKEQLQFVTGAVANGDVLADMHLMIERDGTAKNMTEQSDGLRALYALALYDLVSVGANVVAVDEPEVHMHPTSQRSLARLLKEGQNQKILATHSPDIVSAFSPDSIVSIRAGGRLIQPKKDFLTDDEKLVVHWWVRDKLEPLTANRVIAVEGIADRIILARVADLTGRNLDRLGVSVVETDGAGSMPAIVKLFGADGFKVPMTLLIDEDARAQFSKCLGVQPEELEQHDTVVSNPDLEGEYVSALGAAATWSALTTSGLLSKNLLNNCAKNGPGGVPNEQDLLVFLRNKNYKVYGALAVAKVLDEETAVKVGSVNEVLAKVTGT